MWSMTRERLLLCRFKLPYLPEVPDESPCRLIEAREQLHPSKSHLVDKSLYVSIIHKALQVVGANAVTQYF